MLSKYVTIAFRHFMRYKKYTLINIGGLSVGLAVSMFILLWMTDEWRVDKFHQDGARIYRVFNNYTLSDGSVTTGYFTQSPLADAMLTEIPEVEQAIRVSRFYESSFQHDSTSFTESGYYADQDFFGMFTFPLVKGNSLAPIPDKNSIAISHSFAEKFFKNKEAIGQIIKVDKIHDLKVTAVFQDPPETSSLKFNYIIPFDILLDASPWLKEWNNHSLFTYVKLKEDVPSQQVNEKLNAIFRKNCSECKNESFLFRFNNLHLYGRFENGKAAGGRIEYVQIFSIAAFIIIIMACANFTNLATAQASTRWREVGVRKVVGAHRKALVLQFMGESLLLAAISFFFAVLIVEQSLPFFNALTHKKISFLDDRSILLSFTGITVFTGFLAGIYPALYLSAIKPVTALKGMGFSGGGLTGLRKSLVIFQFTLSAILMAGSFTVYQQINFIRSKNLGFEKENILTFTLSDDAIDNVDVIKTQTRQIPGVESIGVANHRPFRVTRFWNDVSWPGKSKDDEVSFDVMSCDEEFIPALKMEIAQGRNFTSSDHAEEKNYLINEKAVEIMGLENPVGAALVTSTGEGKIIGVVKDFHHTNLRSPIGPLIITYDANNRFVFVRINSLAMESTVAQLHQLYKVHNPDSPFQYQWLNESFDQEYESENLMGTLSFSFAVIAIFISCIGLFGLVSFTMERRSKEISIRKVMGASIFRLWQLLSKDFVSLVVLSCLVAVPVSWYFLNQWLQKYAYRTEISWWIFAIAGGSIHLITLLTVSVQSIKAAMDNPVNSLRNE